MRSLRLISIGVFFVGACALDETPKMLKFSAVKGPGNVGNLTLGDVVNKQVLQALGGGPQPPPDKAYDPKLESYLNSFLDDAKKYIDFEGNDEVERIRTIQFVDKLSHQDNPNVISTCNRFVHETPTLSGKKVEDQNWKSIEILNNNNFIQGVEIRLRLVMYHELFHCVFNKGHLPETQLGIMDPVLNILLPGLDKKWDRYVEELFSKKNFETTPDI